MGKRNVLVIYESSSPQSMAAAHKIDKAISAEAQVKTRAAKDVVIPEILAADIFFFGADSPASDEYAEIERLLKGVNLAGRRCGIFSQDSTKALEYLNDMIRDSEIAGIPERLLFSASPNDATVKAWARSVIGR